MARRTVGRQAHTKLQRWTDLIAALLARNFAVTFDQLAREVPAYADGLDPRHKESVKRTFERDKDELKSFGIPVEVVPLDEGESTGYRLNPKRFYLPWISVADSERRAERPAGYRALPETQFEPDEIELLVAALRRLDPLGDPMLAADARTALSKIVFDLPILPAAPVDVTVLGDDRVPAERFDRLVQALRRRKAVSFGYRAPSSGGASRRRVHPYGLFFVHAHWYLAGLDLERKAVRNFRVSRMTHVKVNTSRAQSPDFDVPAGFQLQQHARSRAAWDLGDDQPLTAEVRFTGTSGAARAAASGGEPVEGRDDVRRFSVRRLDTLARWILSLAGDAVPLSPPELVQAWRRLAKATLERYVAGAPKARRGTHASAAGSRVSSGAPRARSGAQ